MEERRRYQIVCDSKLNCCWCVWRLLKARQSGCWSETAALDLPRTAALEGAQSVWETQPAESCDRVAAADPPQSPLSASHRHIQLSLPGQSLCCCTQEGWAQGSCAVQSGQQQLCPARARAHRERGSFETDAADPLTPLEGRRRAANLLLVCPLQSLLCRGGQGDGGSVCNLPHVVITPLMSEIDARRNL